MPVVQLPDGREVDFPDGMSNDDIGSAIQRNFPEFAPKPSGVMGALRGARQAVREFAGTSPEQIAADKAEQRDHAGVMSGKDGAQLGAAVPAPAAEAPQAAGPLDLFSPLYEQQKNATAPAYDHGQELRDLADPGAEARTRRLVRNGMNVEQARFVGQQAAARGIPVGQEGGVSKLEATDVDFDARKRFNDDPFFSHPLVRAGVKGYEGYKQGLLGVNQFIAEKVGAGDVAAGQAQMARQSRNKTDAMGEAHDPLQRNFEGAVSSIAQQLPAMIGGAATGSEPLVLGSMFAQTFGQEYASGRAQGQNQNDAALRAGLFGAFEVVGERFGLGERLKLLRDSARGVETNALAKWMANTLTKELPGEMLTTTGQFGTDKLGGGVGLHQQAGLADYLGQMGDTITQTVMQGALMGGASGGVHTARQYLGGRLDNGAARDADSARRDALNRWETNGLSPRSAASARIEPVLEPMPAAAVPSIADIGAASSVDEAIAAAQAIVRQPATSPHATAADIDALEQAAGLTAPATADTPAELGLKYVRVQDADGSTRMVPDINQEIAHGIAEAAPAEGSDGGTGSVVAGRPGETVGQRPEATGPVPERAPTLDLLPGAESGADPVRAGAGQSDPALGEGWHAFPAESGTLGIPRADMPQVRAEHRGALTQYLKARGIEHEQVEIPAEELKPTQAEFNRDKVQKAHDYQGGERSILVSSDGHVLDGHHQWLASAEKGEPVKAIRLHAPIRDLLEQVKEFPSATTSDGAPQNAAQNIPKNIPDAQRPGQAKLDEAAQRQQKQDEAVRLAMQKSAARKAEGEKNSIQREQESPSSWVIRNKETGEVMLETSDRKKVDALNTAKYEAVPAMQHMQELNTPDTLAYKVARGEKPAAPEAPASDRKTERTKIEAQRKGAKVEAQAEPVAAPPSDEPPIAAATEPAEPAAPAAPKAADPLDGIPRTFLKKTNVEHQTYNAEARRWETASVPADQALRSVRDDIANLEAMLKCMKG